MFPNLERCLICADSNDYELAIGYLLRKSSDTQLEVIRACINRIDFCDLWN
jgi:hypothetical protein